MLTFIGCSGYYYRGWKGQFYPADIPSTKWLDFYAQHFNTIEINATFHRLPTPKSLGKWYKDTPEDFSFSVKAPKLFTHFRRMNGILEIQQDFYKICSDALGDKLRCVLYQFPPTFRYSPEMLDVLMTLGNNPVLHAVEFRDASWWQPDVYAALKGAGVVFSNVSFPKLDDIYVPDDASIYLRFHGKPVLYKSGYGAEGLSPWTDKLKAQPPGQLFTYFNNTWFGEAVKDAEIFSRLLAEHSDGADRLVTERP